MVQGISHTNVKAARKDHYCDACIFLQECLDPFVFGQLSFAEKRAVARARQDGWKIKRSQPYIRQANKMDGDIYTFKARPDVDALMVKHKLYPDDF